ncbi:prefoldin subunit 5 [Danaus plexippus]|uniref:Prefoldin subunit 5 n=1 Tax=Danaus plexippus plexippus TaxID=278856 RepID=A0A212F1J5_DANPL|nr:prefoldin subunit 5 [Danaus plexippus]OWR47607.1 putative prefoldin subunit 5 [Danaus plexippus plexippus]
MATISSAPMPGMQQIDLSKLNIHQLAKLKQQLDQELNVFQDSLQTLKIAQQKFVESGESVEKITAAKGKTILVPLTGSMYVPGTIVDTDNVIIDIGTGYYAQKDIEGAKDYFKRKVQFVTEQMEKIQSMGVGKSKAREAICMMMEMKVQAQSQEKKASTS